MGAKRIKRGTGEESEVDRALSWHKLHVTCDGMAYEAVVCFYIVVEIMAYHGVVLSGMAHCSRLFRHLYRLC